MDIWTEYEAVKAVDAMSAIEVLKYVDQRIVDCRDHTMKEYRIMAVELMKKERAA